MITGILIVVLIFTLAHRFITGHWLGEGKGHRTRTTVKRGPWRVVRRRKTTRRRTVRR